MDTASLAHRIRSILAFQMLFTSSAIANIDDEIPHEIQELLDFDVNPSREKLERVKSYLRLYAILFSFGQVLADTETTETIDVLLDYLDSLMPQNNFVLARRDFVPETLGQKSIETGLCIPLFGYQRPKTPPSKNGILVCYQSIEFGAFASIEICSLNSKTNIQYTSLGVKIENSFIKCLIRIANKGHDPYVTLSPPFPKKSWVYFENIRYDVYITPKTLSKKKPLETYEPLEYRYVYFFNEDIHQHTRIAHYIRDLFVSMYSFSYDEAQKIVSYL